MSTQPTASELLQCNDVIEGMRRAYYESGVGTDRPIEQGGFIVRLQNSEAFTVARLPAGAQTTLTYPFCVNGTF
jgi:hypothetical protein